MSDLVERLRDEANVPRDYEDDTGIVLSLAADEIERLLAIIEDRNEAIAALQDVVERLTRERDRARVLAVSYRQSWNYAAFGELIPYDESETNGIEDWLAVQAKAGGER
jgi:hypothetical protein